MDDILTDDDGDILIEDPSSDLYDVKLSPKELEPEPEEEDPCYAIPTEVVSDKEFAILATLVNVLNDEHDKWCKNATPTELSDLRTGRHISPRFVLERVSESDLENYEANVILHDFENEEDEQGSAAYVAMEIASIRYFCGYHKTTCGI